MFQRRYKHLPLWFKATHALVVCLLVLGTVRSLIPGLCSTLSASLEQAAAREAEVPACCAERLAAEAELPAFRAPSEGKEHPPCAFCHLVMGLGQSAVTAPIAIAAEPATQEPFLAPFAPRAVILAAANGSRAPPAQA